MHFILLNQYYPPDAAPTGVMLKSVAERMVESGHDVTVVSSCSDYGDASKGQEGDEAGSEVDVVRLYAFNFGRGSFLGKVLDYLSYYLGVALYLLMNPADKVIALTTPPYLSVLARVMTKFRGGTHGHWVMDLYPDVMFAHGMLDEQSLKSKVLKRMASFGFGGRRCDGVLALGPDMVKRIEPYVFSGVGIDWVALWSSAVVDVVPLERSSTKVKKWRASRGWSEDEVIFLYSGNMGLGHRFGEFLNAVKEAQNADANLFPAKIRFVFTGGGKRKSEIERFLDENPDLSDVLEVGGYVDFCDLEVHLASADVHLASMEPSWDGTMVPSKFQGILGTGRPVLFVGSRLNSIAQWVAESGAGWVIEPEDREFMHVALIESANECERIERGKKAFEYYRNNFEESKNSKRVAHFFCG